MNQEVSPIARVACATMQFPVNASQQRPTFFELVAADRLVSSLRSALVYSMRVLVSRRPSSSWILDREDECFAAFMTLVETHAFATSNGSMAEGLYGLQRTRWRGSRVRGRRGERDAVHGVTGGAREKKTRALTRTERALSVLTLVAVPYAREKLDRLYKRLTARGGNTIARETSHALLRDDEEVGYGDSGVLLSPISAYVRTRSSLVSGTFVKTYPFVNALLEAVTFAHWLSYLIDGGETHDPILGMLGLKITRVSPIETSEMRAELGAHRAVALNAARMRGGLLARIRAAILRAAHVAIDHAQGWLMVRLSRECHALHNAYVCFVAFLFSNLRFTYPDRLHLSIAVITFKLAEWWYGTAEGVVERGSLLPPPPPPPLPPPALDGVGIAPRGRCPVCRCVVVDPSTLACSGYVLCSECAFEHVQQVKSCPVTLIPSKYENVRRLFDSA